MNPYNVRQVDAHGKVLSETQVTALDYEGVLRHLKNVSDGTRRIEVYNQDGGRAGEISVDYWRQKKMHRR